MSFLSNPKDSPDQINIPPFTSTGGITPDQQTLANYTYGQDLMGPAALFGGSGTGMSTMATQGATGAKNTEAGQIGGMSDVDQNAAFTDYKNQVATEEQGLQNDITLGNQSASSLTSLAGAAGNLLGSGTASNLAGGGTAAASLGSADADLGSSIEAAFL